MLVFLFMVQYRHPIITLFLMNTLERTMDLRNQNPETREIVKSLFKQLPDIAESFISRSCDFQHERNPQFEQKNKHFLKHPDSRDEHSPPYHQWGIITHSKMFEKYFHEKLFGECDASSESCNNYLQSWGIESQILAHFNQFIDGRSKKDLMNIAIPFHDIGKFTERELKIVGRGEIIMDFSGHEKASGKIIRSKEISSLLQGRYYLTPDQIEYIARCGELHYELGLLRKQAANSPTGYTLRYARGDQFQTQAKELIQKHGQYAAEVGILFLGDSLAKTDFDIHASTDEEIEDQKGSVQKTLYQRRLDSRLIKSIVQVPVQKEIAKNYLQLLCGRGRDF